VRAPDSDLWRVALRAAAGENACAGGVMFMFMFMYMFMFMFMFMFMLMFMLSHVHM
jgi:hypothetical protein